jgi:hypothetical protein
MKLQQIEAIKAAKLRLEQARCPDQDISVAIKTTTGAQGSVEVIITRSRKAA